MKISDAQDTHNGYVNTDVLSALGVQLVRYISITVVDILFHV